MVESLSFVLLSPFNNLPRHKTKKKNTAKATVSFNQSNKAVRNHKYEQLDKKIQKSTKTELKFI